MKLILTTEEKEQFFYSCLCNAVGTGYMDGYGITIDTDENEYQKAKRDLVAQGESPCLEDVWMQVLRNGGTIDLLDVEGEGENSASLSLKQVHSSRKWAKVPIERIIEMHQEQDDAETADFILQTLFFGEVIFG